MDKNTAIALLSVGLSYFAYKSHLQGVAIKRLCDLNIYYANKMDDAGVQLTEFDVIAINEI
jgi:hypothetical protein